MLRGYYNMGIEFKTTEKSVFSDKISQINSISDEVLQVDETFKSFTEESCTKESCIKKLV